MGLRAPVAAGKGDDDDEQGPTSKRRSVVVVIVAPPVVALIVGETRCLIASMARREARSINDARGRGAQARAPFSQAREKGRASERSEGAQRRERKSFEFPFARVVELDVFRPLRTTKKKNSPKTQSRVFFFFRNARRLYLRRNTPSTDALDNSADAAAPLGCHARIRCRGRDGGARARSQFHRRRKRSSLFVVVVVVGRGASVDSEPLSTPAASAPTEGQNSSPSPPSSSFFLFCRAEAPLFLRALLSDLWRRRRRRDDENRSSFRCPGRRRRRRRPRRTRRRRPRGRPRGPAGRARQGTALLLARPPGREGRRPFAAPDL